ncbi:hypothetical protein EIK77_005229 [Talaromyces pinophilus]|nr:hypothetical protein EIK77_005229 [Talaromyces pinophilus]
MLSKRTDQQLTLGGYTPMEAHAWKKNGCLRALPGTLAGEWESREAYVQAPWREPPHVVIDEREKAVTVHDRMVKENKRVLVYTDGSDYQGYIGTSMIIPQFQRQQTECIGTEETSTVYAAEACGIKFGLKTLLRFAEDDSRFRRVVIFSDSQSALQSIQNPRMASYQTYIRDCINLYWECVDNNIDVILRWIPGHEGIPGNGAADGAAKRAAMMGARRQIFNNADPEAMATYEALENEEGTDLGKSTATQAGDVNARSAHSPIRTNNRTNTSQGSIPENEPVDEDAHSEPGDVENAQLGELSYVGDERARICAIDLWD